MKKRCSELENKCGWTTQFKNFPPKNQANQSKKSESLLRDQIYKKKQSFLITCHLIHIFFNLKVSLFLIMIS